MQNIHQKEIPSSRANLVRQFMCSTCGEQFSHSKGLYRHYRNIHHENPAGKRQVTSVNSTPQPPMKKTKLSQTTNFLCRVCDKTFNSLKHLQQHFKTSTHIKTTNTAPLSKLNKPNKITVEHFIEDPIDNHFQETEVDKIMENETFKEKYAENWPSIRTHFRISDLHAVLNYRWENLKQPDWFNKLLPLIHLQKTKFKLNFSHSFILRHIETGEYRYFHSSSNNNAIFKYPRLINNTNDLKELIKNEINEKDPLEYARQSRPDTKWTVDAIVASSFYLWFIPSHPIGCCNDIPQHILLNQHIDSLINLEDDNLCFFRALSNHKNRMQTSEGTDPNTLFKQYLNSTNTNANNFKGVFLAEIPELEQMFNTPIYVYKYISEEKVTLLNNPSLTCSEDNHLNLLLVNENHFCYIKDIKQITHSFACSKCSKIYRSNHRLNKHFKKCSGVKITQHYPGGYFFPSGHPLQKLFKHFTFKNIDEKYIYPFRATFDIETYFEKHNLPVVKSGSNKTKFTARHKLLSIGICSNVEGFEDPVCLISSGDSQELVASFVSYLESIANKAFDMLAKGPFKIAFDALDSAAQSKETDFDVEAVRDVLIDYLRTLPVIGFNSSSYDLNVLKPYLARIILDRKALIENEQDNVSIDKKSKKLDYNVIKKGNNLMSLTMGNLKFLDVKHFVAPGFSYAKYLKAFNVEENKGFFPYEYITNLSVLEERELPSREHFYSSLKKTELSIENYNFIQSIWKEHKMSSIRDLLVWYQNLDTKPFLVALETQVQFYAEKLKLDMLKCGISIPGLTMKYVFKTLPANTTFSVIGPKDKDLHSKLRSEIVGGPSICFTRYLESDVTRIRHPEGKLVKKIYGYDMNSLYLYCMGQPQPTGNFIRYVKNSDGTFDSHMRDCYGHMALEWLNYEAMSKGLNIKHKFNGGEEKISHNNRRIRLDGYSVSPHGTRIAFEFYGCFFHGCNRCEEIKKNEGFNKKLEKSFEELAARTREREEFIKNVLKIELVTMWECDWRRLKSENKHIRDFVKKETPHIPFALGGKSPYAYDQIKNAILREETSKTPLLFGLVRCDIRVPNNPDLLKKFSEFTPIFKNVEVSREDIGPFMKKYAVENNILNQPRRTLIGSYHGKDIVLITPLLRWYVQHGLEIVDIHEVVQYTPKTCFDKFVTEVSSNRRIGAADPSQSILADTFKLLGNSCYGKFLEDSSKHQRVLYLENDKDGGNSEYEKVVSDSLFKKADVVGDDKTLFEVEMNYDQVSWYLPLQIGFFVYQYAKLKMLSFYYDFLDYYFDRSDFELAQMDTDSMYMGFSDSDIEKLIKPHLRVEYFHNYGKWWQREACESHTHDFIRAKLAYQPWIRKPCCEKVFLYDKFTPGLMKVEYVGDSIVSLCSKTYFCAGEKDKISCKGLNKSINNLMKEDYIRVLENKKSGFGVNTGFRYTHQNMFTYTQQRHALSYLYIKRKVGEDGVSTKPLDL